MGTKEIETFYPRKMFRSVSTIEDGQKISGRFALKTAKYLSKVFFFVFFFLFFFKYSILTSLHFCILHGSVSILFKQTRLFKYTENFTTKKGKFSDKRNLTFFHISAQNIDCGYSLEPPRRGGSNEYPKSMFLSRKKNNAYPCKPQFYYIKSRV